MKKQAFILLASYFSLVSCEKKSIEGYQHTLYGFPTLIIGHRGYPGLLPDHTLEGYAKAIDSGADMVEPDLVMTKDSVLIARHEPMLSATTNVSQMLKFASKKTKKKIDGVEVEDWFASDFSLAEIKELRAKQPLAERNQGFNNLYTIPTFNEVIALVKSKAKQKGRMVGIYPETKHPTFHEHLKLPITDKLLEALDNVGWNNKKAPVYIQSFEVANLQYIHSKSTVRLVQLIDGYDVNKDGSINMTAPNGQPFDFVISGDKRTYNDLVTEQGLNFIKTYADGIGVWKPYIIPYTFTDTNNDNLPDDANNDGKIDNNDFKKLPTTDLIKRAHKKVLVVHAYTFRDEVKRLLYEYNGNPIAEYKEFFKLGIDGVFTDFTATAVSAKK